MSKNTLHDFLATPPMVENWKVLVVDMLFPFIFFQKHLEHFQIKKIRLTEANSFLNGLDLLGLKAPELFFF